MAAYILLLWGSSLTISVMSATERELTTLSEVDHETAESEVKVRPQ